ncbi:MAG: lytic transglycosylase domain-containing protein, partial [Alphaproteobacteria bacterium]|nr:lytic transglycosylase domain-containing protein [Alphaproteobacteria bacterium]
MSRLCFLPLLVLPLLLSPVAEAAHWVSPENPSEICRSAISKVERAARVPKNLMQAIALVESGRQAPEKRENVAWPWTINAEGKGAFFPTKDAALAEVRRLQAKGVRSIDVGCMQVNLHHHGDNFASLEEAFDPVVNALYAATFLQQLFEETESWSLAVQRYHSANPVKGEPYRAKVDRRWREEHARYADETRNGAIELTRLKRAEAISRHLEINGLRQVDREGDAEAPPTAPARGYQLAQLSLAQRNATNFAGPTVPQSATSATGLGQRAS